MYIALKNLHLGRGEDGKQIRLKIGEAYDGKDAKGLLAKGYLEEKKIVEARLLEAAQAELKAAKEKVAELEKKLKGEKQKDK